MIFALTRPVVVFAVSDWVAVAGPAFTAAAAAAIALINSRSENERDRRRVNEERWRMSEQAASDRLQGLSTLLGQASVALTEASSAFGRRRSADEPDERTRTGEHFNETGKQVDQAQAQIALHVGKDAAAYKSYRRARDSVKEMLDVVYDARDRRVDDVPKLKRRADDAGAVLDSAHEQFLKEARSLIRAADSD
jgi:hypothetical protein